MLDPVAYLNMSYLIHLAKDWKNSSKQFTSLENYLLEHKCTFKGEPMPMLFKPYFITPGQANLISYRVEKISSALNKFIQFYLRSENVRRMMKFSDRENELFSFEPGYEIPLVISRLDAFLNDYSLKFLEFNCDSPAGIAYSDVMEEGFKELFKEYPFLDNWRTDSLKRKELLLEAILTCYNEFRANLKNFPAKPVIAIVDWEDVSTYSEFLILEELFIMNGYDTIVCPPESFRIAGGYAYANDQRIHLVYKRVITRELLEKWDECSEFVLAIKEGLVCCCNSFRSFIVGNKKVLAIITDPSYQSIFDREELEVIRDSIPWTKILSDTIVTFNKKTIHLKDLVLKNRKNLVLKPANLYGGKEVYIGRETDQEDWERIMNEHITDESWVVQEYIDIPQEIFPEINDTCSLKLKYVNINPFGLLGKYSGTITRVSDNPVINVSAGGGLVPTFCPVRIEDLS